MKSKITFFKLILSAIYGIACFFILGIVIRYAITYMYTKSFSIDYDDIYKTFIMSCIAGGGAAIGSWIFAKIDERKNKSPPPQNPKA